MSIKYPPIDDSMYLEIMLTLLSSLQPNLKKLSPTEILTLKTFMLLPIKYKHQRFTSPARKIVLNSLAEMGWKIKAVNLNAKVTSLLTKGYLFRDTDGLLAITPALEKLLTHWQQNSKLVLNVNPSRSTEESGDTLSRSSKSN